MNNLIVLDSDLICHSVGGWSLTRGVPGGPLVSSWYLRCTDPISCTSSDGRDDFSSLPFCYWEKTPEVSIAITNVVNDNLTCAQIVVVYGFRARPRF